MIKNLPYPTVERIMEVTAFKDPKMAEAAQATLMWLDNGAPHKFNGCEHPVHFDMTEYLKRKSLADPACGTACCMAGAITLHMNGEDPDKNYGYRAMVQKFGALDPLNPTELDRLFFPMDSQRRRVIGKTAEQAAYTLRKYLFTGEVEWQ